MPNGARVAVDRVDRDLGVIGILAAESNQFHLVGGDQVLVFQLIDLRRLGGRCVGAPFGATIFLVIGSL